ncbi:hypothetical protein [Niallia circulans]|jgi:hypothetical protein|uniref:hypothetical protein n=1 Tax=Niallia circulans TaxID=1397 RepID=UPI000AC75A3B|nr:hypothetical protein [Niallia circulans]MED3838140.1 hypothetical protein [Niallia circulans]MED4241530.1 hypothetical protein [Niallia circulans]MED4247162.1 hypothetical protein [Niallia circulans]MED5100019.1 hypothetical protein [Niallia circulans]QKH59896.1 hypothetical protein FOC77_04070 [Niallia circulans]
MEVVVDYGNYTNKSYLTRKKESERPSANDDDFFILFQMEWARAMAERKRQC